MFSRQLLAFSSKLACIADLLAAKIESDIFLIILRLRQKINFSFNFFFFIQQMFSSFFDLQVTNRLKSPQLKGSGMSSSTYLADIKIIFIDNFGAHYPWFYSSSAKVIKYLVSILSLVLFSPKLTHCCHEIPSLINC